MSCIRSNAVVHCCTQIPIAHLHLRRQRPVTNRWCNSHSKKNSIPTSGLPTRKRIWRFFLPRETSTKLWHWFSEHESMLDSSLENIHSRRYPSLTNMLKVCKWKNKNCADWSKKKFKTFVNAVARPISWNITIIIYKRWNNSALFRKLGEYKGQDWMRQKESI